MDTDQHTYWFETMSVVEEEPLLSTGLLDSRGNPIHRIKEKIGFNLTRKHR
jgi:hypothetical protein